MSAANGLTFSSVYGTRVEDKEVSLNVCDVSNVLAIFQSSTENDPELPNVLITNTSASIDNLVKGELLVGSNSKAVASFVESNSTNSISFVYRNNFTFTPGETIKSKESNITIEVGTVSTGDQNITNNYIFDSGQRSEYLDFSRLIRKPNAPAPTGKIRIIYDNYTIKSDDGGDFVTVNSYDEERYNNDIKSIGEIRVSDIIDVRPRVSPYSLSSTRSPFEPASRIFSTSSANSSTDILIDQDFTIQYNYYLPRIDVLTLSRQNNSNNTGEGIFSVIKGVPALIPSVPTIIPDGSMSIAVLKSPAYTFNVNDIKIDFIDNKRYTMRDIGNLETRLSNVEYATSLNLLELQTRSLTQVDSKTGLNKFQSGFFVDNFSDLSSVDLNNPQFRSAIDKKQNILRQQHYTTYLDLQPRTEDALLNTVDYDIRFEAVTQAGSAYNARNTGNTISMDYTHEVYLQNQTSTNHFGQSRGQIINHMNQQNYIGIMELKPNEDIGFYQTIDTDQDTAQSYKPEIWSSWDLDQYAEQDPDRCLRPRNIEIIAKNLKPFERYYCYLDGVNVSDFVVPKLIEIRMLNNRAFTIGEAVHGLLPGESISIRLRVAHQNHKYGPYNKPTESFGHSPYSVSPANMISIPTQYSATSTLLNVDLASLSEQVNSNYWGGIKRNMILHGRSSGALAQITEHRLKTNGSCEFFGSLLIPDPNIYPDKKFSFSTKTILLSSNANYSSREERTYDNTARANFYATTKKSSYTINTTIPTIINNDVGIAQIFDVVDPNGIFLTKCDIYFRKKPTNVLSRAPIVLQIRETENGFPTNKVVDNSTVSLTDVKVNVGNNVATTFTFESLVYLEPGKTYAITLLSEWAYEVATSRGTATVQDTTGIIRTMEGFKLTSPSTSGFGLVDYDLAKKQGYSDADIRYYLKVVYSGRIQPAMVTNLNNRNWGRIPITTQRVIPLTGPNSINVVNRAFTTEDYQNARQSLGYTENDIANFLLNDYTGVIGPSVKDTLVRYATINLFSTTNPSGRTPPNVIPRVGSLCITNGSTWDESPTDKLTFRLHRARFDITRQYTPRFMNPDLALGNGQGTGLKPNALTTYSRKIKVGLNTSFTISQTGISIGNLVRQTGNDNFSGIIESLVGPLGVGSTLSVTLAGIGFTSTPKVYTNVPVTSLTGVGVGARVNISVGVGGIVTNAVVSQSGSGYASGDTLTIDNSNTDNMGRDLVLTIPNNVGIISSFDTFILDNVQHDVLSNGGNFTFVNDENQIQTLTGSTPTTSVEVLQDGQHLRVELSNHGYYAYESYVLIGRLIPDTVPSKTTVAIPHTVTTPFRMVLDNVGIFTTFEGLPVGAGNTGYLKVDEEIMAYDSVNITDRSLNIIQKGVDGFIPKGYDVGSIVYKYELSGVSLRRISSNIINLNDSDLNKYPIELDSFHLKFNPLDGRRGTVRDGTTLPRLYFNSTKTTGRILNAKAARMVLSTPRGSKYIPFNNASLVAKTLTPSGTSMDARIRTISHRSIDGNEVPYQDLGYVDIPINDEKGITFNSPRVVLNRDSESIILPRLYGSGDPRRIRYSLGVDFTLSSTDNRVSPIIDRNRLGVFLTSDRIDKPVSDFVNDPRVNSLTDDPHASIYISKEIKLKNSSDTLTVILDANLSGDSDLRVMYRLLRPDLPDKNEIWQFFPGFNNKNSLGFTIDSDNNDGTADSAYQKTGEFVEYKFSETNLPPFTGFQIKIIMASSTNANSVRIKNLRGIATI